MPYTSVSGWAEGSIRSLTWSEKLGLLPSVTAVLKAVNLQLVRAGSERRLNWKYWEGSVAVAPPHIVRIEWNARTWPSRNTVPPHLGQNRRRSEIPIRLYQQALCWIRWLIGTQYSEADHQKDDDSRRCRKYRRSRYHSQELQLPPRQRFCSPPHELRGPTTEWLVATSMLLALAAYTAGAPDSVRCRRFNADSRCPPALPPRDRYPSFPRQNHRARRFPPAHDSDPQWADAWSDVRSW